MTHEMKKMKGVTILELLVVTMIVALLAGLILVVAAPSIEKGKRTVCTNNLKQLFISFQIYTDNSDGWAPPAVLEGLDGSNFTQINAHPEIFKQLLVASGAMEDLFWCPSSPVRRGDSPSVTASPASLKYSNYGDPGTWLSVAHLDSSRLVKYRPADLQNQAISTLIAEHVWGNLEGNDQGPPTVVFYGPHGKAKSNQLHYDGHASYFDVNSNLKR